MQAEFENVIITVDNGIGKEICGTVLVRNAKKKFPDKNIIVVCGYTDVFHANPNIYRTFVFNRTSFLYDDYIQKTKSLPLKFDPYSSYDFVYKTKHISQVWCEGMGLPWDNPYPEIFLTTKEKKIAQSFIDANCKKKPLMLIQPFGGVPPQKDRPAPKMYVRDLDVEIAQKIVDYFALKYTIIHIKAPTQPKLQNTIEGAFPLRTMLSLVPHAEKILCIDSVLQHASAAFKKKAVVVWGGTSPKALGYDCHQNLTREVCPTPFCGRPNSFLFDQNAQGSMFECPHGEECMNYTADEIIKALEDDK